MDEPIVDSVAFTMLPLSTQALWFHLVIRAEWDGAQYRINKFYAKSIKDAIGATAEDVRILAHNEMLLEYDGYVYLENVAIYPGPVVHDNGVKEVAYIFPGSRMEYYREQVSEYRRRSVFDLENK